MDPKLYGYSDDALQDVNPRRVVNGPSHVHVAEQGDSVGPGAPGRMSPVGQHEAVHAPRASRPHHNHSAVSQSHAPQAAAPVWPPSQPAKAAASEPRLPQESKPSNPADAIAQIQQQRSSKHLEKVQVPLGITRKSSQQRVHPLGHRSGSSAHKSMTSITSRDIGSSADTLPSLPSPYKGQQSPAHAPVAAAMHAQPSTGSTTRTRSPSNTEISSVEKSSPHRSLSPASQVASTHGQDSLAHKQATHHSPAKRSGSIADSFPSPHAQEHQKAEHSLQAEAAPVNDQEQIAPRKAAIRQSASPQKVAAQQAKDVEAQDIAYPPISKVVQQLKNSNQSVESSSSSEAPVQVPAAHAVSGTPSVAPGRLQAATSRSAIAQPQRPFVPAKSQESTAKVIANSSAAVPAPGSVQKAALAAQPAHLAPDTVAFPTGGKGNYKQAAVALATGASSLAVQRSLDASTQPDSTQLPSARDQPASPSDCAKPGALEVVQGEEVVQEDAGKSDSKRERSETERKDIVRTVSATETESSMQSASPGAAQAEGAMQGHIVGGAYDVGRKVAPSRPAPSKGAPALPSVAEGAEGTMPSAAGGGPLKSSRMLTSSIQRQPQPPRHMKGQQWRTTEDTDTSDMSTWRRRTDGSGPPSVTTLPGGDSQTHSVSFPARSVGTPDQTLAIADGSTQQKVGSGSTLPDASVSVDVQNGAGAHPQVPVARQQWSVKVGGLGYDICPSPMLTQYNGDSTADIAKPMKPPQCDRNSHSKAIPIAVPPPPPQLQSNVTPVPDAAFENPHPINRMFVRPIITSGYQDSDIWECHETSYENVTPSPGRARHGHMQGSGRSPWWCLCGKV